MVCNPVVQLHRNPGTATQVIVWKHNSTDDEDDKEGDEDYEITFMVDNVKLICYQKSIIVLNKITKTLILTVFLLILSLNLFYLFTE